MHASIQAQDLDYLRLALAQAQKALPLSQPNPAVGCVIVSPNGSVLALGHTQRAGGLHAEAMALAQARERGLELKGASVYVTLEPCAHQGKTPPCAQALVAAQVGRVVALLQDPNPLVAGKGFAQLQQAGIATILAPAPSPKQAPPPLSAPQAEGVQGAEAQLATLVAQAEDQMRGFLSRMRRARPWVRLKAAASLDGLTALPDGSSHWITSEAARRDVHLWRARAGCIVTGIGTILADEPSLNVRLSASESLPPSLSSPNQPHLAILDRQLRTPLPHEWRHAQTQTARDKPAKHTFWDTLSERQCMIFCDDTAYHHPQQQARLAALREAGAQVLPLPSETNPLAHVSELLFDIGVNEIHIEAGAQLSGAWMHARRVDELLLYVAPRLLGQGRPLMHLPALSHLGQAQTLQWLETQPIGEDLRLRLLC